MKRPPKPFVVERKRRSRLDAGEPPSIWTGPVGRELQQGLAPHEDREGDRSVAVHVRAGESANPAAAAAAAPVNGTRRGRILEAAGWPNGLAAATAGPDQAEPEAQTAPPLGTRGRRSRRHPTAEPGQSAPPGDEAIARDPTERPAAYGLTVAPVDLPLAEDRPAPVPSYRRRRQAATGGVPPGERWKRSLRFKDKRR